MPKRLTIEAHLQIEELQKRYRNSSDPVYRSHHQIIWLLAEGKTVKEVAAVTSYSSDWIYKLARRYNQFGENVLGELLAAALALPPSSQSGSRNFIKRCSISPTLASITNSPSRWRYLI